MMKQDLFVLTDRRLVLNHCTRIISSSFIIFFNSVREYSLFTASLLSVLSSRPFYKPATLALKNFCQKFLWVSNNLFYICPKVPYLVLIQRSFSQSIVCIRLHYYQYYHPDHSISQQLLCYRISAKSSFGFLTIYFTFVPRCLIWCSFKDPSPKV